MKAILIDSQNEQIKEVEIDGSLESIYEQIGCRCMAIAHYMPHGDIIFVDDEGMLALNENSKFFLFEGAHQPFAGNGLIMGSNDEGESEDVKIALDRIPPKVQFNNIFEIQIMQKLGRV